MNVRKLHRQIAPVLFLPLILSALTGIGYRLGRSWFNISDSVANTLMAIHEGRYLGQPLVAIYVLLVGMGLLGLLITGLQVLLQSKRKAKINSKSPTGRQLHRLIAPIAFLPLLISASTGIAYRLGRAWFNLPNEPANLLLSIHQGSYLGPGLRPIYICLVGVGLLILAVTGINMSGVLRSWRRRST